MSTQSAFLFAFIVTVAALVIFGLLGCNMPLTPRDVQEIKETAIAIDRCHAAGLKCHGAGGKEADCYRIYDACMADGGLR